MSADARWRAIVDPRIERAMAEYDDATNEELVEVVIQLFPPSYTWPTVERRWLREAIEELRGTEPIGPALTSLQREKIPLIPGAVAKLRRSSTRGATISAVATAIGVDRGTLSAWIDRGLVTLKPD